MMFGNSVNCEVATGVDVSDSSNCISGLLELSIDGCRVVSDNPGPARPGFSAVESIVIYPRECNDIADALAKSGVFRRDTLLVKYD